ncbi:MAG: hypothetical protein HC865_14310 [Cyanobacteria bacterium RU_5_0]|nr:hypothetical protein [Cyanobacteria bacterium RU_5_0]
MRREHSIDFYHGWLIEIIQVEDGFESICYSPCRETFSNHTLYTSEFEALGAAKQGINQYGSYHSLKWMLRELYEAKRLSFGEWQAIQQSLVESIRSM